MQAGSRACMNGGQAHAAAGDASDASDKLGLCWPSSRSLHGILIGMPLQRC